MIAWKNGQILDQQAEIPVFGPVVVECASVFDGARLLVDHGCAYAFNLVGHLQRFYNSCKELSLPIPYSPVELLSGLGEVIRLSRPEEAMGLRLFALASDFDPEQGNGADVVIFMRSLRGYALDRPYRLSLSSYERKSCAGIPYHVKAMAHYSTGRLASNQALAAGFDDAVFVNDAGNLTETPRASLVFINGGEAVTAPVEDGVLPGLTRQLVRRVCEGDFRLSWRERSIPVSDIANMEAALICSSSLGVASVEQLGTTVFPSLRLSQSIAERFNQASGPERFRWSDLITEFPLGEDDIARRRAP